MKIKYLIIVSLLLLPFVLAAQERQMVKGRVMAGTFGIRDVLVVNINGERETRTDSLGNFSIIARTGDLFVASDFRIIAKKVRFTPDIIKNGVLIINVEQNAIELEEIVIERYANITSESLGIVPKGQRRYTPAERKLKAASGLKPDLSVGGSLGANVPFDPLINMFSGRTSILKKELETERKEQLIEILNGIFSDDEIEADFKIPKDYVKGFIYYLVEDTQLAAVIRSKNESMIKFLIGGLAAKYTDAIANEK
ncbi:MAG: hypothetical protein EOO45_11880 [Flavobacterium sp.]|nr:MAG: hypothetical protein EOO45_11880 [Flavobacterium sp.]